MAPPFCGSGICAAFHRVHGRGKFQRLAHDGRRAAAEIIERVGAEMSLTPLAPIIPGKPPCVFAPNEAGRLASASVTQPFCRGCTRTRLTADGRLHTCLFSTVAGVDLRGALRGGAKDEELAALIASVWQARGDRYSELRTSATATQPKAEMSLLGG
jgi:cyclic pyranopterin phosphate synthase